MNEQIRLAPPAAETKTARKIFVRGLKLEAYIGAYDAERSAKQTIIVDAEIDVVEPDDPLTDSLENVMCYHKFAKGVQAILDEGHIELVETLAERLVALALDNHLSTAARISIEKPDALDEAAAVGVEIYRRKS